MTELTASESWLYARLSGDATLTALVGGRIYDSLAGRSTAYPLVTFQFQGGRDVLGVSAQMLMGQEVYQVAATGRATTYTALKPIARRIHDLLHGRRGRTADGLIYACVREQPLKLVYVEDGIQYCRLGGLYRLYPAAL